MGDDLGAYLGDLLGYIINPIELPSWRVTRTSFFEKGGQIRRLVEDAPMRGCLLPPLRMTLLPIGREGDIRFAANLQGEQCQAHWGRRGTPWRGGIHRGEIL